MRGSDKKKEKMKGTFEELIDSETPVLIDFFATWCGPCKAMAPALQQLADEMGDKVRIIKIDIDKNQALQRKYKVSGVPTIMVFKNSKQLFRQSGAMMLPQLKQAVKPHL
jgi:thioredoxin 1